MSTPALVSAKWLRQQVMANSKHIRILDGTWHLPKTGIDAKKEHIRCRLPSSKYFDIDSCCDRTSQYPHMLPSDHEFSEYVQKLGIGSDHHVVVYDTNKQFGLFSAPRVWWTFRVFGHNRVSVLDGGLPKWREHNYPIVSSPVHDDLPKAISDPVGDASSCTPKKIISSKAKGDIKPFKVNFQKQLVYSYESVKNNINSSSRVQVGDVRSSERFTGVGEEPRSDLSSGHIPNSTNLPFQHLLDPNTKQMKTVAELLEVFKRFGIDINKPLIGSCGSGVTGSLLAFAAFLCGNTNAAVYDGSWTEWAQRAPAELIAKDKE